MDNPISQRIKLAREQLGLTQAELALELGIAPETISHYENGRVPRPERLRAIAKRLGLDDLAGQATTVEQRNESVGERIRRLRSSLGMSQAQLGALIGVTPSAVSHWEMGVCVPGGKRLDTNAQALVKIAQALGTTTDHLLGGAS